MPTPPTDVPIANSDRTVGVHTGLDGDTFKSLKRDVLLFDQIASPALDQDVAYHMSVFSDRDPDELFWLRDIGIVRDIPPVTIAAATGMPIDGKAIPDEGIELEVIARMWKLRKARGLRVTDPTLSARIFSINLRLDGINAFPLLDTRRQIGKVFPSGATPVLEVILKFMPIPDDQTAWQDIIEFRNDPESMKRLKALRVWTRNFAKATTATSLPEMKEEIEVLLDEYEEHMKIHGMKVNKGAAETLLTLAGKLPEDFVKLKWGELAKLPFIFRERKISLLEAELKAPNRELAFISMARSWFSR